MKHIVRIALSIVLCTVMTFGLCEQAYASPASSYGLVAYSAGTATSDGQLVLKYEFDTGLMSGTTRNQKTIISAEVYNSAGKRVLSWKSKEYGPQKRVSRNFSYDWNNNLASGTYTLKIKATLYGEYMSGGFSLSKQESYCWDSTIKHTAPASIYIDSAKLVAMNDGSYKNKIVFGHRNAKGRVVNMEIYDGRNNKVYSSKGNSAIDNSNGKYNFYWSGFPSGGGAQLDSGNYKIKYWLSNGNAKQSTVWLDFN